MKLNNKRTILVGLAFLSICAFWQMYDSIVPLILTKTFHMNETFSGAIMAADNILALFLLPFFGSVSDKSHSKLGKRMPFILFGTGSCNLFPLTNQIRIFHDGKLIPLCGKNQRPFDCKAPLRKIFNLAHSIPYSAIHIILSYIISNIFGHRQHKQVLQ